MGLMLVEPLALSDVNEPGERAIFVAPLVTQLSVLVEPEAMLVELAVNDEIDGSTDFLLSRSPRAMG